MPETEESEYGREVLDHLRGGCRVKVYESLKEGYYYVIRDKDDEELSVYSFNGSDPDSLPREEARRMAGEYAYGYASGYNDGLEDK